MLNGATTKMLQSCRIGIIAKYEKEKTPQICGVFYYNFPNFKAK